MTNYTEPTESQFANTLDLYLPPLFIIVGFTCNTLVIIIMRGSNFSSTSTALYITCNALIDNVCILMVLPAHWLHVNFPDAIYRGSNSDFICKVFNFLGWSSSDLGIILTAAMTTDRAIAVRFPLQSLVLSTVKTAKYVTGCLIVVIFLKDGVFLISSVMEPAIKDDKLCALDRSDPNIRNFDDNILPIIHNVFLSLAYTVITVSNVAIVRSVRRSFNGFSVCNATSSEPRAPGVLLEGRSSSMARQLTIMSILDSLAMVIFTLPFSVITSMDWDVTDKERGHLAFTIGFYLLYVNRCGNFFLYCISGKKFRDSLKQLWWKTSKKLCYPFMYLLQLCQSNGNRHEEPFSIFQMTERLDSA